MSIKPILFNTEETRALLDGRKSVMRRVVKPQPIWSDCGMRWIWKNVGWWREGWNPLQTITNKNLTYHPGDILYVRETWRLVDFDCIETDWSASVQYKADTAIGERWHDLSPDERLGWRSSRYMPREAARIFLRVTDVRVERLQEITVAEMEEEGVSRVLPEELKHKQFGALWDSTIKPADRERYGWAANPWVWAIEFERCEKPEGWPV